MRFLTEMTVAALLGFAYCGTARASENGLDNLGPRRDIGHIILTDGSTLRVGTQCAVAVDEKTAVDLTLYSKENAITWRVFDITSVQYNHARKPCYMLAKVMSDRILLFATWNCEYCTIDLKSGHVLSKGEGDDILKDQGSLVPIRLTPRIGLRTALNRDWVPGDLTEARKSLAKERRQRSLFFRFQSIPKSKVKKNYIIQFETGPDGSPRPERRPRFVVVWKSEKPLQVSFGFEGARPAICVNGHMISPDMSKKAVYVLLPDYSLEQIPLREDELARLFDHITRREIQLDEKVDALLKTEDPDWSKARTENEELFPPNAFWEQKVDPYIKTVEVEKVSETMREKRVPGSESR